MLRIDKRLEKYFWDGKRNISDTYFVKRVIEYGTFPDMLKIPFSIFAKEINKIDVSRIRASEKRKKFLKLLLPHLENAGSWKEIIYKMARIS